MCVDDTVAMQSSPGSLLEAAKFDMEQIQLLLEQIQHYEKEVMSMAKKAELDIDDVLDFLLSRIMKCISKKKREMKAEVIFCYITSFFSFSTWQSPENSVAGLLPNSQPYSQRHLKL